jgi:HK97 family phage prohead protease
MEAITKTVTLAASPGPAPRTLRFTISTGDQDRMGDTIDPSGWNFSEWQADGAPVCYAHDHAAVIGRGLDVRVVGDRVVSTMEAPPAGLSPLADEVYGLAKAGFLRSASVGFQPDEWHFRDDGGRHFVKQTLREWSIVAVPALAQAKIEASAQAAGLVAKWLGGPRVLRIVPEGFGDPSWRTREASCPAGVDCPNLTQAELCPAGKLCPATGNARTSWRDERVVRIIDDREPVWRVDPAQFTQAWQMAVADVMRETYNRLKGRVD